MKRAFNEGQGFTMGRYDYDNEFVPLHGYPAYEEFVKPKGQKFNYTTTLRGENKGEITSDQVYTISQLPEEENKSF